MKSFKNILEDGIRILNKRNEIEHVRYILIHSEFSDSSDPDQGDVEGHAQDQDHHPWTESDPDQGRLICLFRTFSS